MPALREFSTDLQSSHQESSQAVAFSFRLFSPALKVLRRKRRVMFAERFQGQGSLALVLEHLAGSFTEIDDCHRTMETSILRLGNKIMDAMSELVEQSYHLPVRQEGGFLSCRLGKAAYQGGGGVVSRSVFSYETLSQVRTLRRKKSLIRTGCKLKFAGPAYFPFLGKRSKYRYPKNFPPSPSSSQAANI